MWCSLDLPVNTRQPFRKRSAVSSKYQRLTLLWCVAKGVKAAYVAAERSLDGNARMDARIQSQKECSSSFKAVVQAIVQLIITPDMPGLQGEQKTDGHTWGRQVAIPLRPNGQRSLRVLYCNMRKTVMFVLCALSFVLSF